MVSLASPSIVTHTMQHFNNLSIIMNQSISDDDISKHGAVNHGCIYLFNAAGV